MTHTITRGGVARRLALALAALVALLMALTSLASAAVPGLQRVDRTSLTDSFVAKDRFAACPSGQRLLGGGGRINPAFGQVALDGIQLVSGSSLNGVRARGFEDQDGTALQWSVSASAICADPLPGLVQIDKTSDDTSLSKGVTAQCPLDKALIGGGAETSGGLGEVVIDDLTPNENQDTLAAFGFEDADGTPQNWTITAHAICANPLPGLQVVPLTTSANTGPKTATVSCPVGKKVVGAGGDITGGRGRVVMDDITPDATLTNVRVSAHNGQAGPIGDWFLRAYAICASA
jgi:hypothetical protein